MHSECILVFGALVYCVRIQNSVRCDAMPSQRSYSWTTGEPVMYDAHAAPTDLESQTSIFKPQAQALEHMHMLMHMHLRTSEVERLNFDPASSHQRADEPRLEGIPSEFVLLLALQALQALQTALCRLGRLCGTMLSPSPSPTAMHLKTQAVAA